MSVERSRTERMFERRIRAETARRVWRRESVLVQP